MVVNLFEMLLLETPLVLEIVYFFGLVVFLLFQDTLKEYLLLSGLIFLPFNWLCFLLSQNGLSLLSCAHLVKDLFLANLSLCLGLLKCSLLHFLFLFCHLFSKLRLMLTFFVKLCFLNVCLVFSLQKDLLLLLEVVLAHFLGSQYLLFFLLSAL